MCFSHRSRTLNNSIFVLVSTDLEEMEREREEEEEEGVLLQLTGWWLLKGDGVIILGSSNYIHRHTCHVNANTLTGTEIRSQVMLCLEM